MKIAYHGGGKMKIEKYKIFMIKNILSCVSLCICCTAPVNAQETGPLGFIWGGDHNQLKVVGKVDLSIEQSIRDSDAYSCALHVLEGVGMAPDSWKADYDDYLSGEYYGVDYNRAKADGTMGGRLSAYLYNVDVLGLTVKACGAFIDDQLYSINIESKNFLKRDGITSLVEDSLSQKYGSGESYCSSGICISNWNNEEGNVFIQRTSHSMGGALSYFYGPLKSKQVENWSNYYVNFIKSSTSKSSL